MSTTATDNAPDPMADIPLIHDSEANRTIRNYTLAAMGGGAISHPLFSGLAVTTLQVMMVKSLCDLFGVPFLNRRTNVIINSALGSAATQLVAIASTAIPGVSTPMKGLSGAAISALYTATVGEFYKVHFQKGGTLDNASITDLSKYIVEEYRRGDISLGNLTNPMGTITKMVSS